MRKNLFALLRTFMFVALMPVLSLSMVSCEPEEDVEDIPSVVDPGAVDLGLSVFWANCNVGAVSPEEYGDYFAWGETTTKSIYNSDNSVTYGLSISELESRGIIDADGNLTAAYDAATANWGGSWRMPTLDEMKELIDNCTWKWTTQNGVYGRKVTGPNGNSIFLPAAGYRYDTSLNVAGSNGYYWSATPLSDSCDACSLYFSSYCYDWNNYDRNYGQVVRPVCEGDELKVVVKTGAATEIMNNSAVVGGKIEGVEQSVTCGVIYGISSSLSSTKDSIKSTKSHSAYSIHLEDLIPNTTYYYCAYAIVSGKYKYGNVRSFKTLEEVVLNAREAVDLGLSVKWASCNVGANSPEEYGDYYAWGETEEKDVYEWSTYKWCNGDLYSMTKYCTNSNYGTLDNKTTLDLDDDVAHVKWGGSWRMPTKDEQDELRTECDWEWTAVNGVNGYKVKSRVNDNFIFLPAAGNCVGGEILNTSSNGGRYWSATSVYYYSFDTYIIDFGHCDGDYVDYFCEFRYFGNTVRPVIE